MLFDKIDLEISILVEVVILIPPPFPPPPVFWFTIIDLKLIESDSSICIPPIWFSAEFLMIFIAENSILCEFYTERPPTLFLAEFWRI